MIRISSSHGEHFAVDILTAKFGIALDLEVLLKREVCDGLSGHRTGYLLANGNYQINAIQNGKTAPRTIYSTVHN